MTKSLTREQILALPANRETDALVAEEVMGKPSRSQRIIGDMVQWHDEFDGERTYTKEFPNYTTDIAAAFQVVEKVRGMGYWLQFNTTCDVGLYDLVIYHTLSPPLGVFTFCPLPLAIVRAALLAVHNNERTP